MGQLLWDGTVAVGWDRCCGMGQVLWDGTGAVGWDKLRRMGQLWTVAVG